MSWSVHNFTCSWHFQTLLPSQYEFCTVWSEGRWLIYTASCLNLAVFSLAPSLMGWWCLSAVALSWKRERESTIWTTLPGCRAGTFETSNNKEQPDGTVLEIKMAKKRIISWYKSNKMMMPVQYHNSKQLLLATKQGTRELTLQKSKYLYLLYLQDIQWRSWGRRQDTHLESRRIKINNTKKQNMN